MISTVLNATNRIGEIAMTEFVDSSIVTNMRILLKQALYLELYGEMKGMYSWKKWEKEATEMLRKTIQWKE